MLKQHRGDAENAEVGQRVEIAVTHCVIFLICDNNQSLLAKTNSGFP